jgi:calcineurin-like phosphoesterase family protein
MGHKAVVELGHRPTNYEDLIFDNIRAAGLEEGDVLLNLGDVYLYEGEPLVKEILTWVKSRGASSVLVPGNHDSSKFGKLMRMGWSWVCDRMSLKYHGKNFLFTHVPVETPFEEDLNVHGHLHQVDGHRGGLIRDGKHVLISMELLKYRPIPLEVVAQLSETPLYVLGRFVGEGAQVGQRNSDGIGNVEESEKTCRDESSIDDGGNL